MLAPDKLNRMKLTVIGAAGAQVQQPLHNSERGCCGSLEALSLVQHCARTQATRCACMQVSSAVQHVQCHQLQQQCVKTCSL